MKYKFHELEPSYELSSDGRKWPDEACNNTFTLFWQEINWIAKNMNLDVNKFKVDDMTFGDPVVFYDGQYFGYLLRDFYLAMDMDEWSDNLFP